MQPLFMDANYYSNLLGYNMAVFPDSVDNKTPMIGYLPGKMPYGLSENLKNLCANLVNTKMDKTVHVDRKLITGASPLASNKLCKLAAKYPTKIIDITTSYKKV
tara:strand:+ start:27 stop:338 length:312 start_codon:yes stop_codon:yes gene_type:complete